MKMAEKMEKALELMEEAHRQGEQWVSPTSIGHMMKGGHSSYGSPICKALVAAGLVKRNGKGHYRVKGPIEL